MKNVHTPVSTYEAVNKLFCEMRYRKKVDDYKFLKI